MIPGGTAFAQAPPAPDTKAPAPASTPRKFSSRKSGSTSIRTSPAPGASARPAAGTPSASSSPADESAPGTAPSAAEPSAASGPGKDAIGALVDFLVAYAVWIVAAIGLALALVWFILRGSRSKESVAAPEEARPAFRPSPLEEDEGPRRVLVTPGSSATIKVADVEREYALVVKEEDLKMPPLPEEAAPARRKADVSMIREMLARENFAEAYQQYVEKIEADGKSEIALDVEQRLGSHFLHSGDLEKAAKVLEHHVATHPQEEIKPETYFDLGYIHFRGKTLNKSRRYFRMFVERHTDPVQVDRAKKLLARLDKVQNLN